MIYQIISVMIAAIVGYIIGGTVGVRAGYDLGIQAAITTVYHRITNTRTLLDEEKNKAVYVVFEEGLKGHLQETIHSR